jgi:O-antigen ligase
MIQAVYLFAAAFLAVLVAPRPALGILLAAVLLPATQSLPETGIPGVNPINILILVLMVALFVGKRSEKTPPPPFPATAATFLLVLIHVYGWIVATVFRDLPDVPGVEALTAFGGFLDLKELVMLLLLMYLTFRLARTTEDVKLFLTLVVVGMFTEVAFCILEWLQDLSRVTGHLRKPNSLGAFMSIVGVTTGAIFVSLRTKARWLHLGVALGAVFSALQTFSRGGIVGLFGGLAFILFLRNRYLFILLILMGLSYQVWMPERALQRFDTAVEVGTTGGVEVAGTMAQRIVIWKASIRAWADHPLGLGLNTLAYFSAQYGAEGEMSAPDKSAHNQYVAVFAELSPVGLIIMLWLFWAMFRAALVCMRRGESRGLIPLGMAGLGALVGMGLPNIVGTFVFQAAISGHFWMIMGLVHKGAELLRQEQAPSGRTGGERGPAVRRSYVRERPGSARTTRRPRPDGRPKPRG